MSTPTEAEQAALRHGRWTCVIFIVGCVVLLVRIVMQPQIVSDDAGTGEPPGSYSEYLAVLRPWTTIVVVVLDLWALVLTGLVTRYRDTVRVSAGVRNGFVKASLVMAALALLPGILIWGWYGLPAIALGLGCAIATLVLARRARAATDA